MNQEADGQLNLRRRAFEGAFDAGIVPRKVLLRGDTGAQALNRLPGGQLAVVPKPNYIDPYSKQFSDLVNQINDVIDQGGFSAVWQGRLEAQKTKFAVMLAKFRNVSTVLYATMINTKIAIPAVNFSPQNPHTALPTAIWINFAESFVDDPQLTLNLRFRYQRPNDDVFAQISQNLYQYAKSYNEYNGTLADFDIDAFENASIVANTITIPLIRMKTPGKSMKWVLKDQFGYYDRLFKLFGNPARLSLPQETHQAITQAVNNAYPAVTPNEIYERANNQDLTNLVEQVAETAPMNAFYAPVAALSQAFSGVFSQPNIFFTQSAGGPQIPEMDITIKQFPDIGAANRADFFTVVSLKNNMARAKYARKMSLQKISKKRVQRFLRKDNKEVNRIKYMFGS